MVNASNPNVSEAYLGGYTIEGLKNTGYYSDDASIVLGVLRREVGENVGVYSICNYRGMDYADTEIELYNNMLIVGSSASGVYQPCSNFDSWANLICANASSINSSQTRFEISWQFFIAGSKYTFFEFKKDTNPLLSGTFCHFASASGRTIKLANPDKSIVKNASPVEGSIYRPVVSKSSFNTANIFFLQVNISSEFCSWCLFNLEISNKALLSKILARA